MFKIFWGLLLFITTNLWWIWFVVVPSNLPKDSGLWGILVIPVVFSIVLVVLSFNFIYENWDNKC